MKQISNASVAISFSLIGVSFYFTGQINIGAFEIFCERRSAAPAARDYPTGT
jgi:hypothetical protein